MKKDSITVVFTVYKRPQTLLKQLEAITKQSIRPDELILFQDKVRSGDPIILEKSLLERFDKVKIASSNQGVWGRFKYAKDHATGDYICILDDDTIPGRKWLETCLDLSSEREAVYASLGIRLTKGGKYPFSDFYRIGWCSANKRSEAVDFAGHSWFFKRECLDWMFEETESVQAIKTAGEDMGLSFAAYRHGIPTMITPHPLKDFSVWGSMPNEAVEYGNDTAATGINGNYENMNTALRLYEEMGWKHIVDRKPVYVFVYMLFQKITLKFKKRKIYG